MTPGEQVLLRMLCTQIRELIASPERRLARGVTGCSRPRTSTRPRNRPRSHGSRWCTTTSSQRKLAALDDVNTVLTGGRPGPAGTTVYELDAEQEEHLLGACNDLRLVLAELIDGDGDRDRDDDDDARDPRAEETIDTRDLLDWLTALVSSSWRSSSPTSGEPRDDGEPRGSDDELKADRPLGGMTDHPLAWSRHATPDRVGGHARGRT